MAVSSRTVGRGRGSFNGPNTQVMGSTSTSTRLFEAVESLLSQLEQLSGEQEPRSSLREHLCERCADGGDFARNVRNSVEGGVSAPHGADCILSIVQAMSELHALAVMTAYDDELIRARLRKLFRGFESMYPNAHRLHIELERAKARHGAGLTMKKKLRAGEPVLLTRSQTGNRSRSRTPRESMARSVLKTPRGGLQSFGERMLPYEGEEP